ncbi:MAG TPA: hypothetical protein VMM15_18570 [Bradyrhizobium sp.]|nr:hypothetical protein [Bradyrhizobium sp.]
MVDQDDVPLAKSFISQRKTELPRPAASRAMPQPLMPPPMMARSKIRSNERFPETIAFVFGDFAFDFELITNQNESKRKSEKIAALREHRTFAESEGSFLQVLDFSCGVSG